MSEQMYAHPHSHRGQDWESSEIIFYACKQSEKKKEGTVPKSEPLTPKFLGIHIFRILSANRHQRRWCFQLERCAYLQIVWNCFAMPSLGHEHFSGDDETSKTLPKNSHTCSRPSTSFIRNCRHQFTYRCRYAICGVCRTGVEKRK